MASILPLAGRGLALFLLAAAPALAFIGGYPFAYALMAASLLIILWWLCARPGLSELRDVSGLMMFAAPVLIAVAFAVTADEAADLAFAGNFAMLALFPLLRAALERFAFPSATVVFARAAAVGTAIAVLVSLYQVFVEGRARAEGFGSDPIWAAQAAIIVGFLPLVGLTQEAGRWRFVYLLSPVLAVFVVLLCGSRGPFLAVAPLVAVALLLSRERLRIALALVVLAIIGGLAAYIVAPASLERIWTIVSAGLQSTEGGIAESSIAVRIELYEAAWRAFLDAPLAGHGWADRLAAAYSHVAGGGEGLVARSPIMAGNRHLHADLLDLGVGAGVLGILAYGLALAAPVAGALRSPRDRQRQGRILGSALLATGTIACGVSYIMFGYEFPTTLYAVLAAVLVGACRDDPSRPRP